MDVLIASNTYPYRYNGSLLRTPMVRTLQPKAMYLHPVFAYGEGWETFSYPGGRISTAVGARRNYSSIAASATDIFNASYEAQMEILMAAQNEPSNFVSVGANVGSCWYGGNYCPTKLCSQASGIYYNTWACGYLQYMAYYYELPNTEMNVSEAYVSYNSTTAMGFGDIRNTSRQLGNNNQSAIGLIVTNSLPSPSQINAYASTGVDAVISAPAQKDSYNYVDIHGLNWQAYPNYLPTGCVPIGASPGPYSKQLNSSACRKMSEYRHFYVIPFIPYQISSNWPTPNAIFDIPLYWAALYTRINSLQVVLDAVYWD